MKSFLIDRKAISGNIKLHQIPAMPGFDITKAGPGRSYPVKPAIIPD
jgi:hypothetical protein